MAKNIAKSVRITDEVYSYINAAPGLGFNEKFENIILEAKQGEAERKKNLAELDEQIKKQKGKLKKLFAQYGFMTVFFKTTDVIQRQLSDMSEKLEEYVKED